MKPQTKAKAFKVCTEVMMNTNYPQKGTLFDLMMPVSCESHCGTCSCTNYMTYTGFSIKPADQTEVDLIRKMTTAQRKEYAVNNPDKVVKD